MWLSNLEAISDFLCTNNTHHSYIGVFYMYLAKDYYSK